MNRGYVSSQRGRREDGDGCMVARRPVSCTFKTMGTPPLELACARSDRVGREQENELLGNRRLGV